MKAILYHVGLSVKQSYKRGIMTGIYYKRAYPEWIWYWQYVL